jgi:hypothetical protein
MHDLDTQAIDAEVDARLEAIRVDPGEASRYDLNGDGIVDEQERAFVRKVVFVVAVSTPASAILCLSLV